MRKKSRSRLKGSKAVENATRDSDTRREIVEHPFGGVKQWMNQGAFLMRGLDKARAEFSLTALVYNMRRAINILGVEEFWRGGIDEGRAGLREPVCPPMGAEMALQLGSVEFCTSVGCRLT